MRWLAMLVLSVALAASATWAASRATPDAALPQPVLGDAPEDIAELPCSGLKLVRLRVAERELNTTILRLLDLDASDQQRRVLAHRRKQLTIVRGAIDRTERAVNEYPCAGR